MDTIQKIDDDLRSLGSFKDNMLNILYMSEDVRNLTMPVLDDARFDEHDNFFGRKEIPYYNPDTQETEYVDLTGHCFDVPYIDSTITDVRAIITLESFITKINGTHVKEVELDIFAFSHKALIHMSDTEKVSFSNRGYSGNRVDMMVSAIHSAVKKHAYDFGIGKIMLNTRNPVTPYMPNQDFYGKKISFLCSDFYIKPRNVRN